MSQSLLHLKALLQTVQPSSAESEKAFSSRSNVLTSKLVTSSSRVVMKITRNWRGYAKMSFTDWTVNVSL